MTHTICIGASPTGQIVIWCTCTPKSPILQVQVGVVLSLSGISELAHEHIEAADREVSDAEAYAALHKRSNWPGTARTAATVRVEGYRAESALTSEDQLIDIETGD